MIQTLLSPSGDAIAVVTAGRVLVYNNTATLQSTLAYDGTILKLCWNSNSSSLSALLDDNKVIVWDLKRSVVASTRTFEKAHDIVASSSSDDNSIFVLVQHSEKIQVLQVKDDKIVHKIKVGKANSNEDSIMALSMAANHLVVLQNDQIRIIDPVTGNKVHKLSHINAVSSRSLYSCKDTVVCLDETRSNYILVNVKHGNKAIVPRKNVDNYNIIDNHDNAIAVLQLVSSNDSLLLLWDATARTLSSLSWSSVDETLKKHHQQTCTLKALSTVTIAQRQAEYAVSYTAANTLIIVWQELNQVYVVTRSIDTTNKQVTIDLSDNNNNDTTTTATTKGTKRDASVAIGPAQAGGEATVTESNNKKVKTEIDDTPTVAERLRQLQETLDEEETQAEANITRESNATVKPATTESLVQLVQQALQSGDSTMLEIALQVKDPSIVRETCNSLSSDDSATLLVALTTRLATRPQRAEFLVGWISLLLKSGRVHSVDHLQPLRNLLQDRIEIFPILLKLEGRLSMLGAMSNE